MAVTQRQKLRNCIQCGKVFLSKDREELCNDCKAEYYNLADIVKEFVKDHPGSNVNEVSAATTVSKKLIQRMMREGVFMDIPMGDNFMYACASCGKPIKTGTYCTSCLTRLRKETQQVAERMQIRVKEGTSTIKRLDMMAQREFEKEQRDKKIYHMGLKNVTRPAK